MPKAAAAVSVSFKDCSLPGSVEVPKTTARPSLGTISFRSSSRFPVVSGVSVDTRNISTRAGESSNESRADRIVIECHHYCNRTCGLLVGGGVFGASRNVNFELFFCQVARGG